MKFTEENFPAVGNSCMPVRRAGEGPLVQDRRNLSLQEGVDEDGGALRFGKNAFADQQLYQSDCGGRCCGCTVSFESPRSKGGTIRQCLPAAGQLDQPAIEGLALVGLHRVKCDAHSQTCLGIDDDSSGLELRLAFADAHANLGANWKWHHCVYEAATWPKIRRARRESRPRAEFDDLRRCRENVAIRNAALGFACGARIPARLV